MYARRSGLWLAIAAGAGACERCTWQLEYVEPETTSGASSGGATQGVTGWETGGSAGESRGGASFDLGGSYSGSMGGAEGSSAGGAEATSTGDAGDSSSGGSSEGEGTGPDKGGFPPPGCGNGLIEPWEVCDDGDHDDGDICPSGPGGCDAPAVCGDGYVWAGVEECDDGDGEDENDCSNDCLASRTVFVTEKVYFGDMLGGVNAADDECKKAAAAADLSGEYRAWLSEGFSGPASTFDSEGFSGWYRRVDGQPLAHGWDGLTNGESLDATLSVTEFGENVSALDPYVHVWTGTDPDGSPDMFNDCSFWKQAVSGRLGGLHSVANGKWTSLQTAPCDTVKARLYCFEVSSLRVP